jgi:hypothetical protein
MMKVREFRPRSRPSRAGLVLAVILGGAMLLGTLILGAIAAGTSQVTYRLHGTSLDVGSGSFLDGTRTFALSSIQEMRVVDLRGGRRSRGTGAPGICTGQWWYPELGSVWQATGCTPQGVVLRVSGEERPIVVSPPDADAFIAAVKAGTEFGIELPAGDALLLKALPGAAAVLLLFSSAMIVAVFVAGPKRMRYVVADGRLSVQTLFSKQSWPVAELRARAHVPKVTMRLFGTAFPGYYTGLYRADGANTKVYATDLKSGVLVEGPARVYVSPADPDAFLAALREAGAH